MTEEQPIAAYQLTNLVLKSGSGTRARQSSIRVEIQNIFPLMTIKTHHITSLKKRQILCGSYVKIIFNIVVSIKFCKYSRC